MLYFQVVEATENSGIKDRNTVFSDKEGAEGIQGLMPVNDPVISSDNRPSLPLAKPSRDLIEEVRGRLGVGSGRARDESSVDADGRKFKSTGSTPTYSFLGV